MANKIIIAILVLLVIITGSIGYYSFTLNEQIGNLDEQLAAFKLQQEAQADTVSKEIFGLRNETLNAFNELDDRIDEASSDIDSLGGKLETAEDMISELREDIDSTGSQLEILDERISANEAKAGTLLDAGDVYKKVVEATVRIGDGVNTIGSGVIFDSDGHVLTASHVVESLSPIYVMLYDGSISRADITGQCFLSDIAVLELENIPSVAPPPLADTSLIEIGEPVVAIGSPLDLRDTLTSGIISQVNRYAEIQYETETRWISSLLQFDAAVNPGNSGCPLINSDGEIIGVVIARVGPLTGDGIYYAVNANKAKRVAAALIADGSFAYPWVGVIINDISPQFAEELSLESYNGVYITSVDPGSPAYDAGILVGDIITGMDDVVLRNAAELTSYLGENISPGDIATITVQRNRKQLELKIVIGARE